MVFKSISNNEWYSECGLLKISEEYGPYPLEFEISLTARVVYNLSLDKVVLYNHCTSSNHNLEMLSIALQFRSRLQIQSIQSTLYYEPFTSTYFAQETVGK